MVRIAKASDLLAIYDLICDLEEEQLDCKSFEEIYYKCLNNDDDIIFVYEPAGILTGVLHLRIEAQLHHAGKVAEIMELAVERSCRSHGIGSILFDQACCYAKNHGCQIIELTSNKIRERAHQFYLRRGMEKTHVKLTMSL